VRIGQRLELAQSTLCIARKDENLPVGSSSGGNPDESLCLNTLQERRECWNKCGKRARTRTFKLGSSLTMLDESRIANPEGRERTGYSRQLNECPTGDACQLKEKKDKVHQTEFLSCPGILSRHQRTVIAFGLKDHARTSARQTTNASVSGGDQSMRSFRSRSS